jgi:short-subunit dehydrogenase involved in D-alanine esterification of teichoic acids
LRAAHPRIDLLINNAGVMTTPKGKGSLTPIKT